MFNVGGIFVFVGVFQSPLWALWLSVLDPEPQCCVVSKQTFTSLVNIKLNVRWITRYMFVFYIYKPVLWLNPLPQVRCPTMRSWMRQRMEPASSSATTVTASVVSWQCSGSGSRSGFLIRSPCSCRRQTETLWRLSDALGFARLFLILALAL